MDFIKALTKDILRLLFKRKKSRFFPPRELKDNHLIIAENLKVIEAYIFSDTQNFYSKIIEMKQYISNSFKNVNNHIYDDRILDEKISCLSYTLNYLYNLENYKFKYSFDQKKELIEFTQNYLKKIFLIKNEPFDNPEDDNKLRILINDLFINCQETNKDYLEILKAENTFETYFDKYYNFCDYVRSSKLYSVREQVIFQVPDYIRIFLVAGVPIKEWDYLYISAMKVLIEYIEKGCKNFEDYQQLNSYKLFKNEFDYLRHKYESNPEWAKKFEFEMGCF